MKKEVLKQFNRDNIVEAAKQLFETKGYDQTTVDDIAREAEYSKSTMYVYFRSKAEILTCIILESMETLKEKVENAVQNAVGFEDAYFSICRELISFQESYPFYFECLLKQIEIPESGMADHSVPQAIYEVGEEINETIRELIEKGIRNNFFRKDLKILPTVFYLWSSIGNQILFANQKQEYISKRLGMTKEEYLDHSFKLLLKSITQ